MYAATDVRGRGPRFDSIAYQRDTLECYGIVDSIYVSSIHDKQLKIAIVRRLEVCEAHADNKRFVEDFGPTRLRYSQRLDAVGD